MKFSVSMIFFNIIFLLLVIPHCTENVPVDEPATQGSFNLSSSQKPGLHDEPRLGFVQAFLKTLSVIFVSEIGDKTFFIAAIMAMKHPRAMVFLGAISALAFMTILSVLGGWAMSIIPKKYTYYGSVILFFIFGVKMIIDGLKMSPNEAKEEYEEVQAQLRKREEEHAKKLKQLAKEGTAAQAEIAVMQVHPVDSGVTEVSSMTTEKNVIENSMGNVAQNERKNSGPLQFEKGIMTKDVETGYVNKNSKAKIFRVLSHIVVQAFTLTFLAEWGDRSQLATFLLASKDDKFGITLGGIVGHSICTGIAVTGGRYVAQKISVKTVTIIGGIVFVLCALATLCLESADNI